MGLLFATFIAACGGDGGGTSDGVGGGGTAGSVRVLLTDAPVCGMDHVWVTVERVRIYASDDNAAVDQGAGDVVLSPARRIDLATLTGGVLDELGTAPLPAGRYTQVRLILAENTAANPLANAVEPVGAEPTPLTIPSGSESGLKVRARFDVAGGQTADLVLDFDACKSVVQAGNSGRYLLKPVITARPGTGTAVVTTQEQRVNTRTADSQIQPDIAMLQGGGHVVVWSSPMTGTPTSGIFAQRYAADGTPAGGETLVSPSVGTDQVTPSVAALPDGGYVVVWAMLDSSGTAGGRGIGIFMRRFDEGGTASGSAQQVNSATLQEQALPQVAVLAGGDIVVAWHFVQAPDATGKQVAGVAIRRFGADGSPGGPETVVGGLGVTDLALAELPGGGFVVVWSQVIQAVTQIRAQAFDPAGAAVGAVVQVTDSGEAPAVASLDSGGYVVAWRSLEGLLLAQRFAANGAAVGTAIRVDPATGDQREPDVARVPGNGFVVTWAAVHPDGQALDVYARRFGADGAAIGAATRVNTTLANEQRAPSVASASAAVTGIAWMSMNQDGEGWGIYRRLINLGP
jgi:hypothetical protein